MISKEHRIPNKKDKNDKFNSIIINSYKDIQNKQN